MLASVDLHDQPGLVAHEVGYVALIGTWRRN
jgi:hypothetical protein